MQNKNKLFGLLVAVFSIGIMSGAYAVDNNFFEEDIVEYEDANNEGENFGFVDEDAEVMGAVSVANYNVDGSVFQQITDLEQQKVLMELEKERAQLDLDLDRLAAEKIKLQMEMDTLSGRAEQEQQILQNEKAKLEAEAAKIEQEKRALVAAAESGVTQPMPSYAPQNTNTKKKAAPKPVDGDSEEESITDMYKLINVMGAGNQLQATLSDLATGQTKRVSVGKNVNGFVVKSISLEDGVVFSKDGETQNLNEQL